MADFYNDFFEEEESDEFEQPPQRSSRQPRVYEEEIIEEEEIPIRDFELPESESLRNLPKEKIAEFILNNTTPELMLQCLKEQPDVNEVTARSLDEVFEQPTPIPVPAPITSSSRPRRKRSYRRRKPTRSPKRTRAPRRSRVPRRKRSPKRTRRRRSRTPAVVQPTSPYYGGDIVDEEIEYIPPSDEYIPPPDDYEQEGSTGAGRSELNDEDRDLIENYKKLNTKLDSMTNETLINRTIQKIERIEKKLRARGLDPDRFAFGSRNKFGVKSNSMVNKSLSSKTYGIQQSPSMTVTSNQMVYPKGVKNSQFPTLSGIKRNYPGPTGNRLSSNQALRNELAIAFGKRYRSKNRKRKPRRKSRKKRRSKKQSKFGIYEDPGIETIVFADSNEPYPKGINKRYYLPKYKVEEVDVWENTPNVVSGPRRPMTQGAFDYKNLGIPPPKKGWVNKSQNKLLMPSSDIDQMMEQDERMRDMQEMWEEPEYEEDEFEVDPNIPPPSMSSWSSGYYTMGRRRRRRSRSTRKRPRRKQTRRRRSRRSSGGRKKRVMKLYHRRKKMDPGYSLSDAWREVRK